MKDDELKAKPEKPDNHVTLTVVTVDGNCTDSYNVHNPLQKVVDKTVDELSLLYDLSKYGLYRLSETTPLELSLKIEQVGLKDGDKLELRPLNAGGGERL